MRRPLCLALALVFVGGASAAAEGPPAVDPNPDGRRAIRGRFVDEEQADPERAALRAFEEEAFGQPDPAAAEDSAEVTSPPPEKELPDWVKTLKTGDLPVRFDKRVIKFLEFYRDDPRGRSLMASWLRRMGRFQDLILTSLRRNKLPEDLIFIAMIESSFDPLDYSRTGASGLWQFMPAAGNIYGLRQDHWIDERNDPEKATAAQMLYFQDIYERFGNWDLALASFNCGYGAVLKSMAKYGTNDFWALLDIEAGLPWESSVYVPKFLAAVVIWHNRKTFGFDEITPDPPWSYDRVTVPKSVDLAVVARAAGVPLNDVKALNPHLRRGRTPPGIADFTVRVPRGTRERFAQTFPQLASDWDSTETYVLRHGERFEDVARTFGISTSRLRDLNGVREGAEIRGGTLLVVPRIDGAERARNAAAANEDLYHSDVVPGGPDEPLLVAVKDKDLDIAGKKRVFYRVVAGDSLDEIAGAFGVPAAQIAAWNGLDMSTQIAARMVLMVFVPPDFDADKHNIAVLDDSRILVVTTGSPEHLDIYEGRKGRVREKIVVKPGETLESIGRRYHLTQYDVARINRRGYTSPLVAGEELTVYKVVDREKAKKTGVFKPPKHMARKAKATKGQKTTKATTARAKSAPAPKARAKKR